MNNNKANMKYVGLICIFLIINILITSEVVVQNKKSVEVQKNYENKYTYEHRNLYESKHEIKLVPIPKKKETYYDIPLSEEIQEYIKQVSTKYNMDYKLMLSVVKLESDFDSNCISNNYRTKYINGKRVKVLDSQDKGLFQINSKYESWYAELAGLKEYDVMNPKDNIRMGIAGLNFFKAYWIKKGIKNIHELQRRFLNTYNMGVQSYNKYMSRSKTISRPYDREVYENLKTIKLKITNVN